MSAGYELIYKLREPLLIKLIGVFKYFPDSWESYNIIKFGFDFVFIAHDPVFIRLQFHNLLENLLAQISFQDNLHTFLKNSFSSGDLSDAGLLGNSIR